MDIHLQPLYKELEQLGIEAYINSDTDTIFIWFLNIDDLNLWKISSSYSHCWDIKLRVNRYGS